MKIADASNSRSPLRLLKRELARIHISRGILKIRISVMELGRFTLLEAPEARYQFDYAPRGGGTQRSRQTRSASVVQPKVAVLHYEVVPVFPSEASRFSPICNRFECSGMFPLGVNLSTMTGNNWETTELAVFGSIPICCASA